MAEYDFEFSDGTLKSIRSLLHPFNIIPSPAGQVGTGCCPIPIETSDQVLIRAIHQKVEREALSASQDFFARIILAQWTSPESLTEHTEPQRALPLDW